MGFIRKNSSSSSSFVAESTSVQNANVIWHNVGIPCPTSTVEEALLEANYAAFYQSDTYNEISAVAADLPVAHPTLDPSSSEYVGYAQSNQWPGTFQPEPQQPKQPKTMHSRSQSDAGCDCPVFEKVKVPKRSKSDAGAVTDVPFDLSTPWNPTFPPYSKYYKPVPREAVVEEEDEEDDGSGVGRPQAYDIKSHRLSELIDPFDLVPESNDRFGSFSSVASSSYGGTPFSSASRSRSVSPATTASSSRNGSRKPSLADNIKPLPAVLESPSGTLFSASEFAAHPNRPLAIRERQEHIRAAIENLESQTRLARSASRKGSADADMDVEWKTGFGYDGRKGSKGSIANGTAYGGFGVDNRPPKTLEEMRIEEGKRAYAEKCAKKGESRWGFSALRRKS